MHLLAISTVYCSVFSILLKPRHQKFFFYVMPTAIVLFKLEIFHKQLYDFKHWNGPQRVLKRDWRNRKSEEESTP